MVTVPQQPKAVVFFICNIKSIQPNYSENCIVTQIGIMTNSYQYRTMERSGESGIVQ